MRGATSCPESRTSFCLSWTAGEDGSGGGGGMAETRGTSRTMASGWRPPGRRGFPIRFFARRQPFRVVPSHQRLDLGPLPCRGNLRPLRRSGRPMTARSPTALPPTATCSSASWLHRACRPGPTTPPPLAGPRVRPLTPARAVHSHRTSARPRHAGCTATSSSEPSRRLCGGKALSACQHCPSWCLGPLLHLPPVIRRENQPNKGSYRMRASIDF